MSESTENGRIPTEPKELREYFRNIGRRGGKARSAQKRKASQTNIAKARESRWKKEK